MEGSTVTINNGWGLSPVWTTSWKQAKTSANKEAPTEGWLVINNSFTDDGEKGDQTTTVTTPNWTKLTVWKWGIAAEKIEWPITITNEF